MNNTKLTISSLLSTEGTVYSFLVLSKTGATAILRHVHINIMHECERIMLTMSRGFRKSRIVQVYTKSRTNVPSVINLLGIYADRVRGHWEWVWGEVNPTALVTYGVFILISSHAVLNNCGEMSFRLNPYFEHLILCFCKHECIYASRWAKVSLSTQSTTTRSTTLSKIPINAASYLMCISGYQKGICATRVVIVVHCSCYI